jgi:uracil-DNA glycosylase
MQNLIEQAHPEWHDVLSRCYADISPPYIEQLDSQPDWLPEKNKLFAAFSLPLSSTQYILLGESPYPRAQSANGYAFWDNAVKSLWSPTGLSKEVNRATSLRNIIKMLLLARGDLSTDLSQESIAALNKAAYLETLEELFHALMRHGFLLLNASLVYSDGKMLFHARQWRPFIHRLLLQLAEHYPSIQLIQLGRIAEQIPKTSLRTGLIAEHPYNISFITNPEVLAFFKPLDLLAHRNPS